MEYEREEKHRRIENKTKDKRHRESTEEIKDIKELTLVYILSFFDLKTLLGDGKENPRWAVVDGQLLFKISVR